MMIFKSRNTISLSSRYIIFFVVLWNLGLSKSWSQKTSVAGEIIDSRTGEGIPYANIIFKNTTIGTISNLEGHFLLETDRRVDTLLVSALGYKRKVVPVIPKVSQEVQLTLMEQVHELEEIRILPTENPAHPILRKIIKHRKYNDPERYDRYNCEEYSKMKFSLVNLDDSFTKNRFLKNHKSVFIKGDSAHGGLQLPIYFLEKLCDKKVQNRPICQMEVVKGKNVNGLGLLKENELQGYTSSLNEEANFYRNIINMFGKNFISPISSYGLSYYKYYLVDSVKTERRTCYKIKYRPRRPEDLVFEGDFWVDANQYALTEIQANMSQGANINWVNHFDIHQSFKLVNDSIWFYKQNDISASFDYYPVRNSNSQHYELMGDRVASYREVELNPREEVTLNKKKVAYQTVQMRKADRRDSAYWAVVRHEKLNPVELKTRSAIDSLNQVPAIKLMDNLARMVLTGYYPAGKIEVGPYLELLKKNKVEGYRFNLAGRTSEKVSDRYMFWGSLGYGTRDERFKYLLGAGYKFRKPEREVVELSYKDDVLKIGDNQHIFFIKENMLTTGEDNLIAAMFRREENANLSRRKTLYAKYEKEWRTGILTRMIFEGNRIFAGEFVPFFHEGKPIAGFNFYEATLNGRFSWNEVYSDNYFRRYYLGSKFPVINVNLTYGKYEIDGTHREYLKAHTTIKQDFDIGPTKLNTVVEAGLIHGKVPFPLLEIHRGNESFGNARYSYNFLNFMQLASDKYVNLYAEYHLNGYFFNRIPLLRRLGLREVASFKGIWGNLDDRHADVLDFPKGFGGPSHPYYEVGAGCENLLKFFRIEAIWRLSELPQGDNPTFGVRTRFQVEF